MANRARSPNLLLTNGTSTTFGCLHLGALSELLFLCRNHELPAEAVTHRRNSLSAVILGAILTVELRYSAGLPLFNAKTQRNAETAKRKETMTSSHHCVFAPLR